MVDKYSLYYRVLAFSLYDFSDGLKWSKCMSYPNKTENKGGSRQKNTKKDQEQKRTEE